MFLGGILYHNGLLPVGDYLSVTSQSKTEVLEKVLTDWRRFMTHLARRFFSVLALITLVLAIPGAAHADVGVGSGGGTPGTSSNFVLVGQNPLFNRGMNAALAIFDHFVYIGNRTDGSSTCGVGDPRGPGTPIPLDAHAVNRPDQAHPDDRRYQPGVQGWSGHRSRGGQLEQPLPRRGQPRQLHL